MAISTKRRPSAGAKKTEALTLRLDPRVKFAIEMLARVRRQSITAVIESAIEELASSTQVVIRDSMTDYDRTLNKLVGDMWSTDESVRFANLCFFMPETLTYEELRIWETMKGSEAFWQTDMNGNTAFTAHFLRTEVLSRQWENLLEHVDEHGDKPTVTPFDPPF